MELSPEEYGTYWAGSLRVAAGVLVITLGYRLSSPLLTHPEAGATGLGVFLWAALVVAGSFLAVLGLARVVRTAVAVELRH